MIESIAKAFNIEKNEQSIVFILIIQSVFIGFFAGSFDVGASSLFLSAYDASLVPKAFVISGIVGILITSVYTRLQSRMKFSRFVLLNFIFIAIVTSLLRLGFEFTDDKRLVFAVFVMMGPLTIISFLGFWGTVGRLFTLRQGKRLFGLIDTGQIFGIILVSFAIPVLLSFNFKVLNTLLVCTVSIIAALFLQIFVSRHFKFLEPTGKLEKSGNFFDLFKSRYTVLMALFIVFSVFAAFFVHFSFLTVLGENYPDPKALASFLGAFMGTLTIFTILIKTFVYGKMMKAYGLRLALMISPILLGLFTLIAAMIGSIYGYTVASASFAFFFLLIVLSKLFAKSLKDSIEVPASKILYQSLDINIRYDVQARIDGTVNELAAFSSGLLLTGLGMLSFVKIIHFSFFLLLILVLWVVVGYKLYVAYKVSLGSSLEKFQKSSIDDKENLPLLEKVSPGEDDDLRVAAVLEFAPQSWNGYVSRNIDKLLSTPGKVSSLSMKVVDDLDLSEKVKELEEHSGSILQSLMPRFKKMIERLKFDSKKTDDDEIKRLLKSEDPDERKTGLVIILGKNDPKYFPRIIPMFRDNSASVKISAIHAAGILQRKDFVTYLIDLLEDPRFYSYAFNSLAMMSEDILENLEHGFHKTGITEKGMIRITRVMASYGTPASADYLIRKLDHFNREVFASAVFGLQKIKFVPDEAQKQKIFDALFKITGITAWNITAKYSLHEYTEAEDLAIALEEEIQDNFDVIYALLSIAYDAGSVYHIRKNLESGTSEGIGFAIELLDLFIDESVKPFLFPLLDDAPMAEKVRQLQTEYPVELMKPEELFLAIINRDYNQINPFTRISAIHALSGVEDFKPGKDIVAQMFNPDTLLMEEASALIYQLNKELFKKVSLRLPDKQVKHIEDFIATAGTGNENGVYNRFKKLREGQRFNNFKNFALLYIARRFEFNKFELTEETPVNQIFLPQQILFVVEGTMLIRRGQEANVFERGEIFTPEDFADSFFEKGSRFSLMQLKKQELQELIFDNEKTYFPIAEMLMKIPKSELI